MCYPSLSSPATAAEDTGLGTIFVIVIGQTVTSFEGSIPQFEVVTCHDFITCSTHLFSLPNKENYALSKLGGAPLHCSSTSPVLQYTYPQTQSIQSDCRHWTQEVHTHLHQIYKKLLQPYQAPNTTKSLLKTYPTMIILHQDFP